MKLSKYIQFIDHKVILESYGRNCNWLKKKLILVIFVPKIITDFCTTKKSATITNIFVQKVSSLNVWQKHHKVCLEINLKEVTKMIEKCATFGYFRQLKSTFVIDIDFEYNLKEIQRLNNKGPSECYTNIYQNHIACNFFWKHKT